MRSILVIFLLLVLTSANNSYNIRITDNHTTDYSIVIPETSTNENKIAAYQLQFFIKKATGVSIPIYSDTIPYKEKEIIIGKSSHLREIRYFPNYRALEKDGFSIKTVGESLVFSGGEENGIIYGVYHFLEKYMNCRYYAPGAINIPKINSLTVPEINETQTPVFSYRELYQASPISDASYRTWHRLHDGTVNEKNWGLWVHTFDDLVPPAEHFQEHPEYFSEVNGKRIKSGQLCLSNPEVLNVVVENLKTRMSYRPNVKYWSVSQNDNINYCTCEKCNALAQQYGGQSGVIVHFVNEVSNVFPNKIISTLAYLYSRKAPTNITPKPNVNIVLSTIECDRSTPIGLSTDRRSFQKDIEEWSKLTNNILIWDYVVQFRNYLNPFPNLRVLQPNLQYFAQNNCSMVFQQGGGKAVTEFHELRSYLISKLLWDPYINVDEVIDDFLKGYYGEAAPFLREYIDKMHDALEESGHNLSIYGYPYDGVFSYLKPGLIKAYEELFDEAEQAVSGKPVLVQRVKQARIPLDYATLSLSLFNLDQHLSFFKRKNGALEIQKDKLALLNDFVNTCQEYGITRLEERGYTPETFRYNISKFLEKYEVENKAIGKQVKLSTQCSKKFKTNRPAALTDGLFGFVDYNYNWLGFEGSDMEAVIDMGKTTNIERISTNFLQYPIDGVFLPEKVDYYISSDGENYKKVISIKNDSYIEKVYAQPYICELVSMEARFIKIYAHSIKLCPEGYHKAGQPSWIFVDEVMVE